MNFTCQDLQCVFSPHPRPSYVFDAFRALETASGSTSWKSSALIIDHHLRLLLARGPRELRRFDNKYIYIDSNSHFGHRCEAMKEGFHIQLDLVVLENQSSLIFCTAWLT